MRTRTLVLSLLVGAVALALFPALAERFYVQLLTKIMILSIFALSLDLLVGYTGLVSLGHAAYFGVAAYALALAAPASGPSDGTITWRRHDDSNCLTTAMRSTRQRSAPPRPLDAER